MSVQGGQSAQGSRLAPAVLQLPPPVPRMPELEVCLAGGGSPRCDEVTVALRATGTVVAEVSQETRARGVPADWAGVSHEAAGWALAAFGREADAATVALEVAARGLAVYDAAVRELAARRDDLERDRVAHEARVDDLRRRAASVTAQSAPGRVLALQQEAAAAWDGQRDLEERLHALLSAITEAEDRVVRVLGSVDSLSEARGRADDPDRPDLDRLSSALLGVGGDPRRARHWWSRLRPQQREALLVGAPWLVGSIAGLPARVRDRANRGLLRRDSDRLQARRDRGEELDDDEQRLLDQTRATQDALDAGGLVDPETGGPLRPLLVDYAPGAFDGDGRGAVSYGDPDLAAHTAVLVPGMTTELAGIGDVAGDARNLYTATLDVGGDPPAVIAWLGYDAPSWHLDSPTDLLGAAGDLASVTGEQAAETGGHELGTFVDGLRASDAGDPSHLTVVGHSYGSTTAAHGAADHLAADDLVLTGSPGAGGGVGSVDDLHPGRGHVYVGSSDNDPVTWLGGPGRVGLGEDPAQSAFGANRFGVHAGHGFGVGSIGTVGMEDNHGGYYTEGSPGLEGVAGVVAGRPPEEVPGRDEPARDLLGDWARHQAQEELDDRLGWVHDGLDRLGLAS